MVHILNSTGAADSKIQIDVEAPVADVWVCGAYDNIEQHSSVKIAIAVAKDVPGEPDIILIEGAQPSVSVLEEGLVKNVDLPASISNVVDSKTEADTIRKLGHDGCATVEILAQLLQI